MKAKLVRSEKNDFPDGSIIEMVIWEVPRPVVGSNHFYKYRLFFGRDGRRIVGFDNERGKGDHCHLDGVEYPYVFTTAEKLMEDFFAEVRKRRLK
ncbi:toxin-antitoxin system TumE family protein [Chelativorans xinjiangense]|uniref:toxin-antitoxin system TumE family protein n=1 Tax=Chelativorans xinjiangense TaxID=2681485 RepID=UPI0013595FDD|nr:DUF6516 family protein [Chelativorans xinjiangense]